MRLALLAIVFLSACGGQERTRCGMSLGGEWSKKMPLPRPETSTISLELLQLFEDMTLFQAAKSGLDPRHKDQATFCASLNGYTVFTGVPEDTEKKFTGLTWCDQETILVINWHTTDTWTPWLRSAIPHELLHAGQHCSTRTPDEDTTRHEGHENWFTDREYLIIAETEAALWEQP